MDREKPESPAPSPPPHPDPEIAALLDFAPVVRRCKRHDGWTHENQRDFIIGLAETGSTDEAAVRLGRTASGAWKVRRSAGGEGFDAAWDAALALYDSRNPRPVVAASGKGGRWARHQDRRASGAGFVRRPPPRTQDEIEADARERMAFLKDLLDRYRRKLKHERSCRLAGRVVEADYYVRQLTMIELLLDIGGQADRVADWFRTGEIDAFRLVATPVSAFLARVRRDYWREKGEPDRMAGPLLGEHDQNAAWGPRDRHTHHPAVDGPYAEWKARMDRLDALQAEAQLEWEEKGKADAAEWAELLRRANGGGAEAASGAPANLQSSPGFPGEGDHPKDGGGASLDGTGVDSQP